jgi:hypothetical protein
MTKFRIPTDLQVWIDARKRHRLSHAVVQMARELGMNPRKLGSLDNHRQEPWKAPLPEFIAELYLRRFGRSQPETLLTIEEIARKQWEKKQERRARRAAERANVESQMTRPSEGDNKSALPNAMQVSRRLPNGPPRPGDRGAGRGQGVTGDSCDCRRMSVFPPSSRFCQHARSGLLEKHDHLLAADRGKPFEKVLDRLTAFQTIKKVLDRNARSGEYRSASHHIWRRRHDRASHRAKYRQFRRSCRGPTSSVSASAIATTHMAMPRSCSPWTSTSSFAASCCTCCRRDWSASAITAFSQIASVLAASISRVS